MTGEFPALFRCVCELPASSSSTTEAALPGQTGQGWVRIDGMKLTTSQTPAAAPLKQAGIKQVRFTNTVLQQRHGTEPL